MRTLLRRIARRRSTPPVPVTVYTRKECCCCHKAIDVLNKYRRKYALQIEQIDIDSDPALAAAHGMNVPVVAIEGKVRFRGVVNPVLLERLLESRE